MDLPDLTEAEILAWADDHYRWTGSWPRDQDGPVRAAPGETWAAVDTALFTGIRGFPGGGSLRKLLAKHRGVRNKSALPPLTTRQIRAWAEAHRERTGDWPAVKSGAIPEAPVESSSGVNNAMVAGVRGLPGGDSLARLLCRLCGKRNSADIPQLTLALIRRYVRIYHEATGGWPKYTSGPICGVTGETWGAVDNALHKGRRGLNVGLSLAGVVRECRLADG